MVVANTRRRAALPRGSRLDVFGDAGRRRHRQAVGLQAVDVKPDGLANLILRGLDGRAGGDATGRSGT
jgi:hypothetical protein